MKKTFSYDVFCIHQGQLVNQGITFCEADLPMDCETCALRKPEKVEVEVSYASTESITYE